MTTRNDEPDNERPRKSRRISRACDFCHARSIRCKPSLAGDAACQTCASYGHACTYYRPSKKRGTKARSPTQRELTKPTPPEPSQPSQARISSRETWQAPNLASQAVVMDLVEIYFEVVYPIFPFFHQPSFVKRVSRAEFNTDRALFTTVMAMCALSSARIRDGALSSTQWDLDAMSSTSSEAFFTAADGAIPKDIRATHLNYIRACALLSLVSLQGGNMKKMHFHLGIYHMLVKVDGLYDESNWPQGTGAIEIEERRRLYWSMYTLEVFTAACFGSVITNRQAHARVKFPLEIDDQDLVDTVPSQRPEDRFSRHLSNIPSPSNILDYSVSWIRGWNFTTQLYQVLECFVDRSREIERQKHTSLSPAEALFVVPMPPRGVLLDEIADMYDRLPQCFKEIRQFSDRLKQDRYSLQAANIVATMQLLRMSLFTSEGARTDERCQVVRELLQAFANIPVEYLRAISVPLLHHLAGIGTILGSIFLGPLSDSAYSQVRGVLLELVSLLTKLEAGTMCGAGASQRLRHHIQRMDDHMKSKVQQARADTNPHTTRESSLTPLAGDANYPGADSGLALANPDNFSPEFLFPAELTDDWSWAFDFAQVTR